MYQVVEKRDCLRFDLACDYVTTVSESEGVDGVRLGNPIMVKDGKTCWPGMGCVSASCLIPA